MSERDRRNLRFYIVIPESVERRLSTHLFQNEFEQAAFMFARVTQSIAELSLTVTDIYLVQPRGWEVQSEVYLELRDTERAKIMRIAREGGYGLIDCHSHPGSGDDVWFSPIDRSGISEFAAYVK